MATVRPYHHGNLRDALLKAGVDLIAGTGPAGFTLREVARRAGVSHNAPYRHFRDKDQLLATLAAQGFEELTRSMNRGAAKRKTSIDKLRGAGLAYIDFALRRPQHFTVMFDALPPDPSDTATQAGTTAFQTLVGFIEACQKDAELPDGDPMPLALMAWSLVHGVAKLAVAGRFPGWSKRQVLRFARFAMISSFQGLVPQA